VWLEQKKLATLKVKVGKPPVCDVYVFGLGMNFALGYYMRQHAQDYWNLIPYLIVLAIVLAFLLQGYLRMRRTRRDFRNRFLGRGNPKQFSKKL
jgi:hypothetical protein